MNHENQWKVDKANNMHEMYSGAIQQRNFKNIEVSTWDEAQPDLLCKG